MVIYSTIQVKMGLISKPNFVCPILKTIQLFCYSVAHFSAFLLVYVRELVARGYFVRKLSQVLLSIRCRLVTDIPSSLLLRRRDFFGLCCTEPPTLSTFAGDLAVIGAPAFPFLQSRTVPSVMNFWTVYWINFCCGALTKRTLISRE